MLRDATAQSIKPDDKPLADGTVAGLRLLPTKVKGRGQWKLRYVSPTTSKRRVWTKDATLNCLYVDLKTMNGQELRTKCDITRSE